MSSFKPKGNGHLVLIIQKNFDSSRTSLSQYYELGLLSVLAK